MKKTKIFLLTILSVLFLSSCNKNKIPPQDFSDIVLPNVYKTIEYEEDSPERTEFGIRSIVLMTDAEKMEDGSWGWDDGHLFEIKAVTDDGEIEIVPTRWFQMSDLHLESFIKYEENCFCVIVRNFADSSYSVDEYEYNADKKCFKEKEIYNSGFITDGKSTDKNYLW